MEVKQATIFALLLLGSGRAYDQELCCNPKVSLQICRSCSLDDVVRCVVQ